MEQLCFCVFLAVKQMPKGKWICLDLGGSSVAFKSPASRSDVSATDLMTVFFVVQVANHFGNHRERRHLQSLFDFL